MTDYIKQKQKTKNKKVRFTNYSRYLFFSVFSRNTITLLHPILICLLHEFFLWTHHPTFEISHTVHTGQFNPSDTQGSRYILMLCWSYIVSFCCMNVCLFVSCVCGFFFLILFSRDIDCFESILNSSINKCLNDLKKKREKSNCYICQVFFLYGLITIYTKLINQSNNIKLNNTHGYHGYR